MCFFVNLQFVWRVLGFHELNSCRPNKIKPTHWINSKGRLKVIVFVDDCRGDHKLKNMWVLTSKYIGFYFGGGVVLFNCSWTVNTRVKEFFLTASWRFPVGLLKYGLIISDSYMTEHSSAYDAAVIDRTEVVCKEQYSIIIFLPIES